MREKKNFCLSIIEITLHHPVLTFKVTQMKHRKLFELTGIKLLTISTIINALNEYDFRFNSGLNL